MCVCLSVCLCVCLSGVGVQTVHPIDFKLGTIVEEHPRSVLSLFSIFWMTSLPVCDVIGHLWKLKWLSWAQELFDFHETCYIARRTPNQYIEYKKNWMTSQIQKWGHRVPLSPIWLSWLEELSDFHETCYIARRTPNQYIEYKKIEWRHINGSDVIE